jgi:hypothetical protein
VSLHHDSSEKMTDSSEKVLEAQNRRNNEAYARDRLLGSPGLSLDELSLTWILKHIDCFVSQSRGNESVKNLWLFPHAFSEFSRHGDSVWDKFGEAIGNLQALDALHIYLSPSRNYPYGYEDLPIPDWEILTRILSHVRKRIKLCVEPRGVCASVWRVEDSQSFARAIRGHPTITSFEDGANFPYEGLDALCSALATLPALESIGIHAQSEDRSDFAAPEILTELLRVPTLRSVCFHNFSFTSALCQAIANALIEGTAMTKLELSGCAFSDRECAAILGNGLGRNTSVSYIKVLSRLDYGAHFFGLPDTPRPMTSRPQELSINGAVVSALGQNTSLKTLSLGFCPMDESLCTALQNGLGLNETLESLEISEALLDKRNAELWGRAFSSLRTNKALKSLVLKAEGCVFAFQIYIATVLQENASLESLSIINTNYPLVSGDEQYYNFITALQHNMTLKTLCLRQHDRALCSDIRYLTHDEDQRMASLLKKNYALERLETVHVVGDVGAILRLNKAGRRYFIEGKGSSISKGVDVLSRVNNYINCIFLHLLENPTLCDRSAMEMVSTVESNISKRGQASAQTGKESRRRLA